MRTIRGSGDQEGKRSFRVVLTDIDFDVLERASSVFGVGKSELVRRLVRASEDVGPALSADEPERVVGARAGLIRYKNEIPFHFCADLAMEDGAPGLVPHRAAARWTLQEYTP